MGHPHQTLNKCRLIDWLLRLPEGLEERFEEAVSVFGEVEQMPLLSRLEERAIERGLQKGLQQGLQRSILQASEERFGDVPEVIIPKVEAVEDREQLCWLLRWAIRVENLASFEALLEGVETS